MNIKPKIAVVIPSYKVRDHILGVISHIGPEVTRIYIVDDCCPDGSGDLVEKTVNAGLEHKPLRTGLGPYFTPDTLAGFEQR